MTTTTLALSKAFSSLAKGEPFPHQIVWKEVGSLPAKEGNPSQEGLAGTLYGRVGTYLIVGGGCNFPEKGILEGGSKVAYDDVYLFDTADDKLTLLDHQKLGYPISYGSSVIAREKDATYYLGGTTDEEHERDILKITVENEKLQFKVVAQLPKALINGVASYYNGVIYFGIGQFKVDGEFKDSNEFYSFHTSTRELKKLANFPGEVRSQAVGQILNGRFCVFSGGSSTAFTDGYAYDLASNVWTEIAPVEVDGKKISLLGAKSLRLNYLQLLVVGGFNKELWDEVNHKLATLEGEERAAYRTKYFSAEPASYNWNRDVLVYDSIANSWSKVGEIPFDAPCGQALVKCNNRIFCIDGEIKPGRRSNKIYRAHIESK